MRIPSPQLFHPVARYDLIMAYTGSKKREYQLAFVKARRDAWISANGPCQLCGSAEDLEVDHVVPRKLGGGIPPANIWTRRKEVRELELSKCQVLCTRCHFDKSQKERRTSEHGITMYRNGCRCQLCREAQRLAVRRFRSKPGRLITS